MTAKTYYERETVHTGDLYSYSLRIYRDETGTFWVEGSGGAGSQWAKPDGTGGTRSGHRRHRIGTGVWNLASVNQTYRLGLELDDEYIDAGLLELQRDWMAAKLPQ